MSQVIFIGQFVKNKMSQFVQLTNFAELIADDRMLCSKDACQFLIGLTKLKLPAYADGHGRLLKIDSIELHL